MKKFSRVDADRAKAREWLEGATRKNERSHPLLRIPLEA